MAIDKDTVRGLKEAQAVFRQLPEISREAYNDAIYPTLTEIARIAAGNAPNGITGALSRSIGYTHNKKTGQGRVGIRKGFEVFQPGRNGSAGTGSGAFAHHPTKIGHLVEFGHGGPHAAGEKPFMRPAVEGEESAFLNRCRRAGKTIENDMAAAGARFL